MESIKEFVGESSVRIFAVNGKPDLFSLISCASFAAMSLSLSRQTEFGFEVDLLNFFLGCLTLQLMKINLMLAFIGAAFSYSLFLVRSSLDSQVEIGDARISDHVALDIDSADHSHRSQSLHRRSPDDEDKKNHQRVSGIIGKPRGLTVRIPERTGSGVPKFKSSPPPSPYLNISPGLSPSDFLDSPVFLSTVLHNASKQQEWSTQESTTKEDGFASGKSEEKASMQSDSTEIAKVESNRNSGFQLSRIPNDGYNWRKYGRKQVKGDENSRSFYKCTYPNCPTKRKIVRSLDGQITDIVYRGTHIHPKPNVTRGSSSSASSLGQSLSTSGTGPILDSDVTLQNSSLSTGNDDFKQSFLETRSGGDEFDEDEPDAQIRKIEVLNVGIPRVLVQTTSDIDILDDGYRWMKYGQKVVKGNPNPRSYYKCTSPGCLMRKHVERAPHDPRVVITTYEGRHNHDVPAARGIGRYSVNTPLPSNNTNNSLQSFKGQPPFILESSYLSTKDDSRRSFEKNKSGGDE
ncbi:WRKY transcription factor WRKY24-like [Senna tora]|uniref:WRKY transcription factor WRKY24-like n=1 Tax=Senna tora TaxID=362788 RepID=A0A834T8R6_9FABA|nr:WRKY transcription factor WRKY24-like [Senna tora]